MTAHADPASPTDAATGTDAPSASATTPAPGAAVPGASAERVIRVSAVIMRDDRGRVLTVRKRGTSMFMLPGGKPEVGEAAHETAAREFSEELGITLNAAQLRSLGVFRAAAANEPDHVVEAAVFEHPLVSAALATEPHAEIEALEWVDPAIPRADQAPLNTEIIFPALLAR